MADGLHSCAYCDVLGHSQCLVPCGILFGSWPYSVPLMTASRRELSGFTHGPVLLLGCQETAKGGQIPIEEVEKSQGACCLFSRQAALSSLLTRPGSQFLYAILEKSLFGSVSELADSLIAKKGQGEIV